jgi:hypothetical protein
MKKLLLFLSLLFFTFGICQAEVEHYFAEKGWGYQNVDSLVIEQRIKDSAQEYQQYSIPRVAFYDNALPADETEYQDLDKNSILMVTSLVQNPQELPLKNVYIVNQGEKIPLKLILSKTIPVNDPLVKKVFGNNRQDSFYLFPIHFQLKDCQLAVDWTINREGFVVAKYPSQVKMPLDFVYDDQDIEKQSGNINVDFLKQFLNREYSITME